MNPEILVSLRSEAIGAIAAAADAAALEAVRVRFLGRKGALPALMEELKSVPREQKPEFGRQVNDLKHAVQHAFDERKATIEAGGAAAGGGIDTSLPGDWRGLGSLHPITRIIERAVGIFRTLGFTVAEGPDVETVYHNFDALNTPPDHPSRDAQDTFYLDTGELLRCHTSPVQVRYMETHEPPVRIVAPGRCYRRDTPTPTLADAGFDLQRLRARLGGDPQALQEVARAMRTDLDQRLDALAAAQQRQDAAAATAQAHALKGALSSLTFMRGAALARGLEIAAGKAAWPLFGQTLALLAQEARAIRQALDQLG